MKLPKKVEVMDVTLRDGFQHEEMFVPTEAKLWIANKLIDAGLQSSKSEPSVISNMFRSLRISSSIKGTAKE